MTLSFRAVPGIVVLACALASPSFAAATLDHDVALPADGISLSDSDGFTEVRVAGATREFEAGRPDLPWVSERVELPSGVRVVSVEVLDMETAALASRVAIRSAIRPRPGLEPVERTDLDPAVFAFSGFTPRVPVRLGFQGFQRGRNVALLQVAPVRWNPVTGALEHMTRLRVRLHLESSAALPLAREREVAWGSADRGARASGAVMPGRDRLAGPFKPTQLPSLLGSPVAYVIITNDAMAPEFQRLADWKTQTGVPAVVRTLSFIQQAYPFGADDAERIRLFIRDAYVRWGTEWILLAGDTEVLPTRFAYTTFYGGEFIATDTYFSCLDGTWNADADSLYGEGYMSPSNPGDDVDLLAEVYVGRAPTITLAEAQQFVDRTIQYVKEPVIDYQTNVLFFAEVLFPQNWSPGMNTSLDGAELSEEVLPHLKSNPAIRYARLYENHLDGRWEPGALLETKSRVVDSLDVGYNVAVHIGHGFRNVMSCADLNLTNDDALGLLNGNRLTNLYAINCTSNAIDFPCIGEAFLKAPGGGAVSNTGSSRFDFPTAGRAYQKKWFELLYEDSITAVGQLQADQKAPFIAFSAYDGVHRWTQMTLLLLGDPTLAVYTGLPRILTVTHPASVAVSDTGFMVHVETAGGALQGARVTAYKAGDVYTSVLTDGAGDAYVSFRPDSVGDFSLTVTGFDCKPYTATPTVTPVGTPLLADGAPVIDDDALGGTSGDGNGLVDAGEIVDMQVPLTNNGGGNAPAVTATLSTTDVDVLVLQSLATYGAIGTSSVGTPVTDFRISVPSLVEDQREVPFRLDIDDGAGGSSVEYFQLVVHAPEAFHLDHMVTDTGGNADARPDSGETVDYAVRLRNMGTGTAYGVTAVLRNHDGKVAVTDSMASFGAIAPGAEAVGDPFAFVVNGSGATAEIRVSDQHGLLLSQTVDFSYPDAPISLAGKGAATSIDLTWAKAAAPDLRGYNIYRSQSASGSFAKVNPVPTFRTSYYLDAGLQGLTLYYYKVTAVDSSGNESDSSLVASVSTNPPAHALFPIPMVGNTPSSVAIERVYAGYPFAIAVGATQLHMFHPDGSSPVDADGSGNTFGDFSMLGAYYAAGPSIADLDNDGDMEVIGPTWDSKALYVFDHLGVLDPAWPLPTADPIWSSAAIADLDGDGDLEIVCSTNGSHVIAMHHNGVELIDGDLNGSTQGVFKLQPSGFNPGTPALADLDGNGETEIIFGDAAGYVWAWRPNGADQPGFPRQIGGPIYASIAVGYLDGPGDTELDIVVASNDDSVYVLTATGAMRPGWPKRQKLSDNFHTPSPALADMNNDGFLDIISASTDGRLFVYDRNGAILGGWNGVRYSPWTSFSSESSPIVADIDGDGMNDILMGDESGQLAAFSGATASMMAGFPIALGAEMRGTPAACDCDGDGLTEIVGAGWGGLLHMWDYDFPFSPNGAPPWPQFHHDARRTGFAESYAFVDVEGGVPMLPARLELAPPWPNPARGVARLQYAVPAGLAGAPFEVAIFDLAGRRVKTVAQGTARSGRFTVEWDLRDGRGGLVDAGVYFSSVTLGAYKETRKLVVMH